MTKTWRAVLIVVFVALLLLAVAGAAVALLHVQPPVTPTPTAWQAPTVEAGAPTPAPTEGWWAITPAWMSPTATPTPTPAGDKEP